MAAVFRKRGWLVAALVAIVLPMSVLTTTGVASAHERRTVAGKFTFVVGWLTEPALANQPNGIDLRISTADTNDPVTDAEKNLKAEVIQGSARKDFPIRARFGVPGGYTADIIPTKASAYSFHFTGDINGTPINETFESGPGRFNDVQDPASVQFPAAAAAGSTSTDSSAQVSQLVRQVATMDQALRDAQDSANTARTVGFAGLLVGIIGIALAGFALMRGKPDSEEPAQAPRGRAA